MLLSYHSSQVNNTHFHYVLTLINIEEISNYLLSKSLDQKTKFISKFHTYSFNYFGSVMIIVISQSKTELFHVQKPVIVPLPSSTFRMVYSSFYFIHNPRERGYTIICFYFILSGTYRQWFDIYFRKIYKRVCLKLDDVFDLRDKCSSLMDSEIQL